MGGGCQLYFAAFSLSSHQIILHQQREQGLTQWCPTSMSHKHAFSNLKLSHIQTSCLGSIEVRSKVRKEHKEIVSYIKTSLFLKIIKNLILNCFTSEALLFCTLNESPTAGLVVSLTWVSVISTRPFWRQAQTVGQAMRGVTGKLFFEYYENTARTSQA